MAAATLGLVQDYLQLLEFCPVVTDSTILLTYSTVISGRTWGQTLIRAHSSGWKAFLSLAVILAVLSGFISDGLFSIWDATSALSSTDVNVTAEIHAAALMSTIASAISTVAIFIGVWAMWNVTR